MRELANVVSHTLGTMLSRFCSHLWQAQYHQYWHSRSLGGGETQLIRNISLISTALPLSTEGLNVIRGTPKSSDRSLLACFPALRLILAFRFTDSLPSRPRKMADLTTIPLWNRQHVPGVDEQLRIVHRYAPTPWHHRVRLHPGRSMDSLDLVHSKRDSETSHDILFWGKEMPSA